MNRAVRVLIVLGLFALIAGCKKQASDADAIRAGINQHLASMKSLNLDAMDMNVKSVSVQGNEAHADVEFTAKGAAPGAGGMQISYTLQKQNGAWVVQDTQMGGGTQHPASGEAPPGNADAPASGSMPNFRDVVPGGDNSKSLPPGHPPVQQNQ
jgi:hypothetical protein